MLGFTCSNGKFCPALQKVWEDGFLTADYTDVVAEAETRKCRRHACHYRKKTRAAKILNRRREGTKDSVLSKPDKTFINFVTFC
jgi:hypothetical protein